MAVFVIPTSTDRTLSDYTQSTIIDGREYLLRFYWNQRIGVWHLDIRDQDGSLIVAGLALVLGYPLLKNLVDSRLPPGELFLLDRTGSSLPPNIDELGSRVGLIYINDD